MIVRPSSISPAAAASALPSSTAEDSLVDGRLVGGDGVAERRDLKFRRRQSRDKGLQSALLIGRRLFKPFASVVLGRRGGAWPVGLQVGRPSRWRGPSFQAGAPCVAVDETCGDALSDHRVAWVENGKPQRRSKFSTADQADHPS
jgi:hypothetical protein